MEVVLESFSLTNVIIGCSGLADTVQLGLGRGWQLFSLRPNLYIKKYFKHCWYIVLIFELWRQREGREDATPVVVLRWNPSGAPLLSFHWWSSNCIDNYICDIYNYWRLFIHRSVSL